jgi:hypothetical protein
MSARHFLRHLWKAAVWTVAAALTACGDDDTVAPAYRQDLAEVVTDADGYPARLINDTGDTLDVVGKNRSLVLTPDTVYRVQAAYLREADGADLVALTQVLSPLPTSFRDENIRRDALDVAALWRGGRYLNLVVEVKSGGGSHAFAFVDHGTTVDVDGARCLHIELYHSQGADPLYYTRQVYLSCPLWAAGLQGGRDSVEITVATFAGPLVKRLAQ